MAICALSNDKVYDLFLRALKKQGLVGIDFYVVSNGRRVDEDVVAQNDGVYQIMPRLVGGKGGFGSMLRAIGAQIEKTTNREACRDLSGRRQRDVNNEKKLREWIAAQADREREREQKRKERWERRRAGPKHTFHDPTYAQQMATTAEAVGDSVKIGMQCNSSSSSTASASSRKRKARELPTFDVKKASEWLGMDLKLEDLCSSDSDSDASAVGASPGESLPVTESPNAGESLPEMSSSISDRSSTRAQCTSREDAIPQKVCGTKVESSNGENLHSDSNNAKFNMDVESSSQLPYVIENVTSATTSEALLSSAQGPAEGGEQHDSMETTADVSQLESAETIVILPLDLDGMTSRANLDLVGLDVLKVTLESRGLKCGGTHTERADRLWTVKGLTEDQIPAKLKKKPVKVKVSK